MSSTLSKSELRLAIRDRLKKMSDNDRRVESQVIVRELKKILTSARTVAVYMPYLDEPDIRPLITDLLAEKIVICLPKAAPHGMAMHRIQSLEEVQRNPITNIPEAIENAPLDEKTIDVVLVPGRAFTPGCERLGRGNGGYDRWISDQRKKNPRTQMIGLAFECQILQDITIEPHDEKLDAVLTSTKVYRR
jgi:5-formyltetrahydrofolate cyclo-ligase